MCPRPGQAASGGLADGRASTCSAVASSVAASGPALSLPGGWGRGPGALLALDVPAGHPGQAVSCRAGSTVHTAFCTVQTGLGGRGCTEPAHT